MRTMEAATCAMAAMLVALCFAAPAAAQQAPAPAVVVVTPAPVPAPPPPPPPPRHPRLSLSAEVGIGGLLASAGDAARPGPVWGARVGVELLSWLALEARYFGIFEEGDRDVAGEVNLLTNGLSGVVRLTLPLPYVQPFGFIGLGWYASTVVGPRSALDLSIVRSTNYGTVPIGGGLAFPLSRHFVFALEGAYHGMFGEHFFRVDHPDETAPSGSGSFWSATGVLRFVL